MSPVLTLYTKQRIVGRDTPSLDRLVAVLDEAPGSSRADLVRLLALSYVGVVQVLERGVASGWVEATLEGANGTRSTWRYRTRVPLFRFAQLLGPPKVHEQGARPQGLEVIRRADTDQQVFVLGRRELFRLDCAEMHRSHVVIDWRLLQGYLDASQCTQDPCQGGVEGSKKGGVGSTPPPGGGGGPPLSSRARAPDEKTGRVNDEEA